MMRLADINNLGQIQNSTKQFNLPYSYLPLSVENGLFQVRYRTNGPL